MARNVNTVQTTAKHVSITQFASNATETGTPYGLIIIKHPITLHT